MTRAVRTAQFGCSSLRTSATYKETKAAMLSLIPYRTRKSEKMSGNCASRVIDLVCAGIDFRKASQVTTSKERLFVARKGKGVPQSLNENPAACYRRLSASNSSRVRGHSDPNSRDKLRSARTIP